MKKVRTIRIDKVVSDDLDFICERHGDVSWHIEQALKGYKPIRQLSTQIKVKPESKGISPVPIKGGWVKLDLEFEDIWAIYEKKGNRKTAKARYIKLSESDRDAIFKHVPLYVLSTPDKKYRKGFEVYINLECWNDEVTPNGQNQSGRPTTTGRLTPAQRTRAAAERWEADQTSNVPLMGSHAGDIRPSVEQPVRGGADKFMGATLEGDYTRSD